MEISTKYNFNDKVFSITLNKKKTTTVCSFCEGSGKIKGLNNETFPCPKCHNQGHVKNEKKQYIVNEVMTIGQIRVLIQCE